MRFFNTELFNSLRFRIGVAFFVLCIPLMILLIFYNNYASYVVRDQVAQSNRKLVTLYLGQIDRTLMKADDYLYELIAEETDLIIIDQPDSYNTFEYQMAKIRLFNSMTANIGIQKSMDLFFIYSENNNDLVLGPSESSTFKQRDIARIKINEILQNYSADASAFCNKNWCVQQIGHDYYLTHIIRKGNVFVGAWVNVNRLMVPLRLLDFGDVGVPILTTIDDKAMGQNQTISTNVLDLSLSENSYHITGEPEKFLLVGEKSEKGDFNLIVLIPEKNIVEKLPVFQRLSYFMPVGFVLITLLLLFFLRKMILRPISSMLKAMKSIKRGNMETIIMPKRSFTEFEVMNSTFNEMVSQIEKLKINVYEEQLNHQRAELQHLQLQINPHFFLNSLNIIFHLAEGKKYELIQEMSLSLVEYFRYMFRSDMTFVSLGDEIKHTINYLNIQRMRFPNHLTYDIVSEDSWDSISVPPLIIQTFVENIIKHAVTMDELIHIQIDIKTEIYEKESKLEIIIQDTGMGFPKDILNQIKSNNFGISADGQHVGIWNIKRRLALLYQDQAKIEFSNAPHSGANVSIHLPIQP